MKKFLIAIIVILIILLVGQLAYYNFTSNSEENNQISNTMQTTNNINQNTNSNEVNTNVGNQGASQNMIIPRNMNYITERYSGEVDLDEIGKEFYDFINTDVKQIYNLTTKQSINKILQLYDLNTDVINNMNIYSAEDFLAITRQVFKVGNISGVTYSNSYVDTNTYNENENGYTTFYVTEPKLRKIEKSKYIENTDIQQDEVESTSIFGNNSLNEDSIEEILGETSDEDIEKAFQLGE